METFLDPKTQLLVALGAAVAAKCQNCFAMLYGSADKVGASNQEIGAVIAIANKVAAKSRQFMGEFVESTTHGRAVAPEQEGPCGCG
jgi:AhpD family alkylhydroperoxidase